jgi:hypothetical protein
MRCKRAKPADPLALARLRAAEREAARDPAAWGVNREALALTANADVEAGARERRVRRQDVFDRLLTAGPSLDAIRRLQRDIAALHALAGGVACYAERIDNRSTGEAGADLRHRAAERARGVLELTGAASARLLLALCEADVALGRPAEWRALVERESGERLADAQGAVLRAACENLAGAYVVADRRGLKQRV